MCGLILPGFVFMKEFNLNLPQIMTPLHRRYINATLQICNRIVAGW